jgi:sugar lactone lactonase YvrE/DNA-binding IclR family transcriptional regulator
VTDPRFDQIAETWPGAGTLVKGVQIIEELAQAARPMSYTELMKATGLSKATLYRLLGALVEFRYLQQDNKAYRLGPRCIELGQLALSAFDARSAAAHEVARLAEELEETVSLVALDGANVMYIDSRRGAHPLSVGIGIGRTVPLAGSASGKAILSSLPPHRVNGLLAGLPEADLSGLLASLAISRSRGYVIDRSQSLPGVTVISAPIPRRDGETESALVVSVLTDRAPVERQHTIGRDLMEAARRVTGSIGAAPMSITPNPRRSQHIEEGLQCVLAVGAVVGEGPVWNRRTGTLDWVDALAPAIHSFDPATGQDRQVQAPGLVSAVLPSEGHGRVVLTQNGLEAFDLDSGRFTPLLNPERHLPGNRFNDAKCDRRGRLWAGTMALDASMPTGSLYRFDGAASAVAVDGGFQVSNGMDWSPDDRTFYFADTGLHTVFAYDFDLDAGRVSNRRVLLHFGPGEGRPDGLSVDRQGFLWVAIWDGWRVARYAPDGRLDREIDMPVPRPSSCCFGGPDLKTLYITSARVRLSRQDLEAAPLSGGLFALPVDVAGQPVTEFRP